MKYEWKPDLLMNLEEESARLSQLMAAKPNFSYMRLADGELAFLLKSQGAEPVSSRKRFDVMGHRKIDLRGGPGLEAEHATRLLAAYENCSYLDYCDRIPFVAKNLPDLKLHRRSGFHSPDPSRSAIAYVWFWKEFRSFTHGKTCLFCGAEGKLLEQLLKDEDYRKLSVGLFPDQWNPVFVHPRNNGENLSRDLEAIKSDLREGVKRHQPDIVFLALGGAAKIIGTELAEEEGVRVFDMGAPLRGLTYSGTVGYAAALPAHHTFYLRIPLEVFYPALKRAHPELSSSNLLRKLQGQLILEVEQKLIAETCRASRGNWQELDLSIQNKKNFDQEYRYYREKILGDGLVDHEAKQVVKAFEKWRRRAGLQWDGVLLAPLLRLHEDGPWRARQFLSQSLKKTGLHPLYTKVKCWIRKD